MQVPMHRARADAELIGDLLVGQPLGQLPGGWRYAVEIRNKTWLVPEYFAALRRHNVAHLSRPLPEAVEPDRSCRSI